MKAARMHLLIDGKVICHRFLPALCQVAASPDYMEYLCIRFTWTHVDTCMVSWATLHLAIQLLPHQDQCCIVLFIHDKLPLHASKFHPHLGSTLCPSCQRESEDYWHFLECDHVDRKKLFTHLKTTLTEITVKYSLQPSILTTFWLGLTAVRTDTPYPQIEADLPRPFNRYSAPKCALAGTSSITGESLPYGKRLLMYSTRTYHYLAVK